MKWYRRLAHYLAKRGRYKVVYNYRIWSEITMYRYYIVRPSKWMPFGICLHEILNSDPPDLHDHAFPYFSIVLEGGYLELSRSGTIMRGLYSWAFHSASWLHRLAIPADIKSTWTLFFMLGPKTRESGFINEDGLWEPWSVFMRRYDP